MSAMTYSAWEAWFRPSLPDVSIWCVWHKAMAVRHTMHGCKGDVPDDTWFLGWECYHDLPSVREALLRENWWGLPPS